MHAARVGRARGFDSLSHKIIEGSVLIIQLFSLYPRTHYYSTGFAMVAFFVIALGEQHEAPLILP
jgi:hypothetical protein